MDRFGSLCLLPASAAAANKEVKQILEQSNTGGSDEGNDTTPTSKRGKYEYFAHNINQAKSCLRVVLP